MPDPAAKEEKCIDVFVERSQILDLGFALKCALQITRQPGWTIHTFGDTQLLVAGAAEVLSYFA